jgi:4-hydroxy-4-methyl-2-oxoglutarate aldolase
VRAVEPGARVAGRVIPARHAGSVDVFLEAFTTSGPGDVLVVDNGGRVDESCVGDLVALEACAAGLEGLVIWGLHHDTADLRTRSSPPRSATGRCVATRRDDLVLGDDDGVVFVPARHATEVFTLAEAIRDTERAQAERIRGGVSLGEQVRFAATLRPASRRLP